MLASLAGCNEIELQGSNCSEQPVENLLGKFITDRELQRSFLYGNDPFGAGPLLQNFKQEYMLEKQCLNDTEKLDLFWVLLWHIDLDGGLMDNYLQLVNDEVGIIFIDRLSHYVEKESELRRSKTRLNMAIKVRSTLLKIRRSENDAIQK